MAEDQTALERLTDKVADGQSDALVLGALLEVRDELRAEQAGAQPADPAPNQVPDGGDH